MDQFIVEGGFPLSGEVQVSGAKNSALKLLAATLLIEGSVEISNVPDLMDIRTMIKVLKILGADVEYDSNKQFCKIDATNLNQIRAPYELVKTMRASFQVMGPLLARKGRAEISQPGGCSIGPRPVDFHLKAFEEMGASIVLDHGYICASAPSGGLQASHIILDFPSVGATENVIMASVFCDGKTVLENAAREPEIQDLANFLISCGAKIQGAGSDRIEITGVTRLRGCKHRVMPDRIESGTYVLASCITKSNIKINDFPVGSLDLFLDKLRACGNRFEVQENSIEVFPSDKPSAIQFTTRPHPGLATDLQAPMMAYLATVQGVSTVSEGVYENRFLHIAELNRMGAEIQLEGNTALVNGVSQLSAAPVMACDLRAGAAMVLAALVAAGTTKVSRVYHIDRGYERIESKLNGLGAKIRRIKE